MLRLTHVVVLVALASVVVAGPTVRRDEVINVVTVLEGEATTPKPVTVQSPSTVVKVDTAVPLKLPLAADEQTGEPTTANAPKAEDQSSSTGNPPEVSTTTTTAPTTTTTTQVTSSSGAPSTASGVPTTKPPRKTITFDQRQEGKYNIRADLENFVIVVVPSGSSSGASLLDFLTRSAQKKDAYHHHHHHHQTRKHNPAANGKRKNTKAQYAGAPKKKVPQGSVTPEVIVLDESNQRSGQLAVEEFIEGRTPYKVDLSSSARSVDDEDASETHQQQKQQQQQQQQSGASFRFSVEPSATVEARSSGRVRFPQVTSGNYARGSSSDATGRALRGTERESAGFANTNTLVEAAGSSATNHNYHHLNLPGDGTNHQQLPTLADPSPFLRLLRPSRRSANGDGGREDDRLQTTGDDDPTGAEGSNAEGLDNHSHLPSSFDSLEYEPLRSDVDMTQLQLQADGDPYEDLAEQRQRPDGELGGWDELRLLGAEEQCGPDRKRDSYGVCQFVRP